MIDVTKWIPVASAEDLQPRHVYHGKLLGQELAIWRADDGNVNIWENRCLHRGVRLSIGVNTGSELVCQYHGWRYANRNAGCTYIPAHPADAPARRICNTTYPSLERFGLVWTHFAETDPPEPDLRGQDDYLTLRPMPVWAPPELVAEMLSATFDPGTEFSPTTDLGYHSGNKRLRLFIQPVDADKCCVRGVLNGEGIDGGRLALLTRFNEALKTARDRIESEAVKRPSPEPIAARFSTVGPELATMPDAASGRRELRVTVASKRVVGENICSLELAPLNGTLPTSQPGAHIDVSLPNGLVRQYSLVNAPGETSRYIIAVKRENPSTGGSEAIHDSVSEGDLLAISEPRNNFTLRRDAEKTILLAGGIGITPLLAMASALENENAEYELHYFVGSDKQKAFVDRLAAFGARVVCHIGLSGDGTRLALQQILSHNDPNHQVYVCGPGPMLEAARQLAASAGWPDTAVHFEYFKNTREIDRSGSFEIALSRSALTLQVPAGRSILSVLRENGIDMDSSCEQGACGTCMATVLDGEPDHQDVYLNQAERDSGTKIMTCVSRAKSKRLILDI